MSYTNGTVLLSVDRVCLTLGARQILRDVSVQVRDIVRPDCVTGQVICFLGPSGIGKTRLSRIIAGLDRPTSGTVTLPGGTPVHKGLVGMVPQNYLLFDFLTVEDNLAVAGRQSGLSEIQGRRKAAGYVEQFGLGGYLGLYPGQLSGGTRQRAAIVRQLMCSEHLLVLDEPFSGLDLIMKRRACELITQVANLDETNTVILVTHDVTEGMSVADTVWLMGVEAGLPGATIVEQVDLAEQGLCWHPELTQDARFLAEVARVKERFLALPGPA